MAPTGPAACCASTSEHRPDVLSNVPSNSAAARKTLDWDTPGQAASTTSVATALETAFGRGGVSGLSVGIASVMPTVVGRTMGFSMPDGDWFTNVEPDHRIHGRDAEHCRARL